MGFQGAARDPLQHALPFLFSDPDLVKEVLRYTLREVRSGWIDSLRNCGPRHADADDQRQFQRHADVADLGGQ